MGTFYEDDSHNPASSPKNHQKNNTKTTHNTTNTTTNNNNNNNSISGTNPKKSFQPLAKKNKVKTSLFHKFSSIVRNPNKGKLNFIPSEFQGENPPHHYSNYNDEVQSISTQTSLSYDDYEDEDRYHEEKERIIIQQIQEMNRSSYPQKAPRSSGSSNNSSNHMATADKEMEERAQRAKELLSMRYKGLRHEQDKKHERKMQLEKQMIQLDIPEEKKKILRQNLETEEVQISKEQRKKVTVSEFESLAVIGRGAFGEVRLVRKKKLTEYDNNSSSSNQKIYALKSMKKEMMVVKNQVGHVKAERDVLAEADDNNRWLTMLHYSFTDETHLYMVMEYMP
jgi:hypothetical protein